jgi:hypothetical protein
MRKAAVVALWIGMFVLVLGPWLYDLALSPRTTGSIVDDLTDVVTNDLPQLALSVLLLLISLFVMRSTKYEPNDKRWAYATIGMLVGFWFH